MFWGIDHGRRLCYGRMTFTLRAPGNVLRVPGSDLAGVSVRWERPRTLIIKHPAAKPIQLRMKTFMTQFARVTVREE